MHRVLKRFSVDGLVTVVTGASSGIGQHMASILAEAGASLVIVARRQQALDELASDIVSRNPEAKVASISSDLDAVTDFDALAIKLSAPFGSPTRLINAAGKPRLLSP